MDRTAAILESSRRETRFVAVMWLASCAYTVGYYALFGYGERGQAGLVWGMPAWVLWGVVAPWMVCLAAVIWFSLRGMSDEDLGQDHAPPGSEDERDGEGGEMAAA